MAGELEEHVVERGPTQAEVQDDHPGLVEGILGGSSTGTLLAITG